MTAGAPDIVVIASRPVLRRALHHTLEGAGNIHFVQDLPQLRAFLQQAQPALSLVVLAAEVDLDEALVSARYLRDLPVYAEVPLLVVLPDGALDAFPGFPPGPTDMLGSGRLEQELQPRWQRLIALSSNQETQGLLDGLTGLPNRRLFQDRLETTIREARRTGESFAVMVLDIDHFQRINDRHGHAAGNRLLQTAAHRLQAALRTSDTVARYMDDEFTVVLRHITQREDVLRVAEKVVQAMALPLHLDEDRQLSLSVSLGASFFPVDATDAESLLEHAGEAMRAAKRLGRNNVQLYAPRLEVSQQQRQALKSQLRHAQQNGELQVFYQPQVDAHSEDIVGMEALLRWEHPQLGAIEPCFFVPLAEESGLIVSIGEWALKTACRQAQAWQRRYGLRLRLGINLSAVQLMHPDLLRMITDALHDSGLDAQLLELEVTESLSVKAIPHLLDTLQALRALGCSVAIDDFGTGAASLDYLRRLPANRIKIDQSFVRNIGIDPDDEAIVRATVDIAHRLKRSVIAEGVEAEQHLQFLRATGCDELQGYLFCRPLPTAAFEDLLSDREHLLENAFSTSLA
jgi:diguanylate cyclase (GGDEF)-like protein